MRKVFLATPSYSGRLKKQTEVSVTCFNMECSAQGWMLHDFRWCHDSLIVHARNAIVGTFMQTDCTDLFWLDDDVSVGPGVFTRLMMHPVDVVGVVYRQKKDEETYAVNYIDGNKTPDPQTGLLEMMGIPFGMVRMRRAALELITKAHEESWYWAACVPNLKAWQLFDTAVRDRMFFGEDMRFCERYRALGGRIYVDADIPIQHVASDEKVYAGNFGAWLRKQAPVEVPLKVVA